MSWRDLRSSGIVEAPMKPYAGTRFGRQELEAELLTDTPGVLWRWEDIEEPRIKAALGRAGLRAL